jgi:acetyl-CoA synthetase
MNETNLLEDQPIAWTPTPEVIERARLTHFMKQVGVSTWDELYEFSIRDVGKFTDEVVKFLDIKFDPPYEKILDASGGPQMPIWFDVAGLNITEMCLDRWQADEMRDQPALIAECELDEPQELTYGELFQEVEEVSEGLRLLGFDQGDAIGIHLPMIVETVVALLAINRIGAIAVPVFSGYGVEAIASRLNAVKAKALFTCEGFTRRGKLFDAFQVAQDAVESCPTIEKLIVVERMVGDTWTPDDRVADNELAIFYNELVDSAYESPRDEWPPEPTSAEDPLIILYTSGTTGKPKGIAHTHASFPIKAAQDMAFGTDVGRGTRICWYTDIGWMMGPWLIYGALINGATICLYDGAPDYPTPDRMWEFCAKHRVEVLGISPTLIRALAASEQTNDSPPYEGGVAAASADGVVLSPAIDSTPTNSSAENHPADEASAPLLRKEGSRKKPFERHDLGSLRAFASTGEPWNPAPWWWLFEKVGDSKLPIINYSGGTEISGGILMGNPLLPIKPCSFPAPCPGMDVDILDEDGSSVGAGKVGELVIKQPWVGMARGFWEEKERYLDTYWRRFENIWLHGDFAMRDNDGHWFILGRSDDTLKVAGKRVGPAEVESILVSHPQVTEAAVIGIPDEAKGTAMVAFVVLSADASVAAPSLEGELTALVSKEMGKPLAPSRILFVKALPKTRNAKVMRRAIRSAYLGENPGDLSALENPAAVDEIRKAANIV